MRRSAILPASVAMLALAGCQAAHDSGAGGASNSVCSPFPAAGASTTTTRAGQPATAAPLVSADAATALDDCLHRWSYALATSSDDADHVARAAMTACEGSLARWNQQTAAVGGPDGPPIEAPSLITGQPTSPIAEHLSFAQGRALFYVVQARAGHCAAPPMKDGAPVGLNRD